MMAGRGRPSRIASAISSPITDANLNPWPEQALSTVSPGISAGDMAMNLSSGVFVYIQAQASMTRSETSRSMSRANALSGSTSASATSRSMVSGSASIPSWCTPSLMLRPSVVGKP